jgi:hypothetical protein
MSVGSNLYYAVLILHLLFAVVGFGSAIAFTMLGASARSQIGGGATALASSTVRGLSMLSAPAIWATGVAGSLLVLLHELDDFGFISFSDLWISLSFLAFFVAAGVAQFLWIPSQRRVQVTVAELEELPAGSPRPDAQLASLEENGKQVALYGGLVHLSFVVALVLMVWRPGSDVF